MCMVRLLLYYSFWVLKPPSLNADIFSPTATYVLKSLLWKRLTLVNRSNVVFLNNNARPFSARITEKILDLGWFVFAHPLYSLGLAVSDFHLFSFSKNAVNDKKSQENVCGKVLEFETCWILLERNQQATWLWQEVIQYNGLYTTDWN